MLRPDAVLWDLDGTLVDSEPDWMAAEHELADVHGAVWTHEDALSIIGSALPDGARVLKERGIPLSVEEIVDVLVARVIDSLAVSIPWQAGARECLAELRAARIPCALVTMSYSVIADQIVAGSPAGTFQVVVTGDSVSRGKPHPEPYLTAAEQLDVDITRCVAVEDSLTGLASAHAAGARVLGVQRAVAIPSAPGRSRIDSLVGLSIDDLGHIAAGGTIDRLVE